MMRSLPTRTVEENAAVLASLLYAAHFGQDFIISLDPQTLGLGFGNVGLNNNNNNNNNNNDDDIYSAVRPCPWYSWPWL